MMAKGLCPVFASYYKRRSVPGEQDLLMIQSYFSYSKSEDFKEWGEKTDWLQTELSVTVKLVMHMEEIVLNYSHNGGSTLIACTQRAG